METVIGKDTISARAPQRSERKDAKDGATKQGRASANSDDDMRQRIPQKGGMKGGKGLAHGSTKQEGLRIVKNGRSLME